MKQQEITDLIYAWLEPATQCWYKDQCRDPSKPFYAYYKESSATEHGAIIIAESEPNENWKLITSEKLSPFKTRQVIKQELFDLCQQLPLLATNR